MNNRPLVSVIMPVFNSEKYLAEAIESILNQSLLDFEFLIFDDGSTDSSPEIIKQYADLDSRIIAHYAECNVGYVAHLNRGIELSRTEFIARMDSDDISFPHRLQLQKDFLERNPLTGVVGSSTIRIDEDNNELGVGKRPPSNSYLYWQSFFTNPLAHPSVMFRKKAVEEQGGYQIAKMPAEDYDLWTRLLGRWQLANIEEPLLKYREHHHSISFKKKEAQFKNFNKSLIDLWQKHVQVDVLEEEILFLKKFHKGYDDLPNDKAFSLFNKITALNKKVNGKYSKVNEQVRIDFFNRCLYLSEKSWSYSYFEAVAILWYLFKHYPRFVIKHLVYGRI